MKAWKKSVINSVGEVAGNLGVVKVTKATDGFLVKQASKVMPEKYAKGIVRAGAPVLIAGGLVASAYTGPTIIAGFCVKSASLCTTTLAVNTGILVKNLVDVTDNFILAEAAYHVYKNANSEQTPEPTPVV